MILHFKNFRDVTFNRFAETEKDSIKLAIYQLPHTARAAYTIPGRNSIVAKSRLSFAVGCAQG